MLATTTADNYYLGAGNVGPFPYTFRIYANSDLKVVKRDSAGGETTLAYPLDYSITGLGKAAGGNVTLSTALLVGQSLVIRRVRPFTQDTDLRNQSTYFREDTEDALDKLVMLLQQNKADIDHSFKLNESVDPTGLDLRIPLGQAGQVLGWSAGGLSNLNVGSPAVVLPGAGRAVNTLAGYLANNAVFNVLDYTLTNIISGANDAAPFINAAFADARVIGGIVDLPPGQFKTASNLIFALGDPHVGVEIRGVWGSTIIRPTAAVTIAMTLACFSTDANGLASRLKLRGILLDGVNTAGAIGVLLGENAAHLSAYVAMEDFDIYGFHGVNAVGWQIKDLVGGNFENVYVDRCTTGLKIQPSDAALPTVLSFRFCQFRECDQQAIEFYNGYRMHFFQTVVESNFGRGIWMVPPLASLPNILFVEFDGLWCESNCRNDATWYQVHCDGSVAGGGTCELVLKNANWSGPSRSIFLKNIHNLILENIYPRGTAGSVLIDTGCDGFIRNWPHNNVVYTTAVTNNSPNTCVLSVSDAWKGKINIDPATGDMNVISGTPNMGSVANRFGKAYFGMVATYYNQPTYGVAVNIDASGANLQQINVTNGVAFQINNPTNPALSQFLTFNIRNVSGGAMGAITWDTKYKLAGAFVNPATGNSRQITFVYDSGNLKWFEVSRTAADVPN